MDAWKYEYEVDKENYLKLFDECMKENQEQNIEFLEKTIKNIVPRKYAVACQNGTDALMFSLKCLVCFLVFAIVHCRAGNFSLNFSTHNCPSLFHAPNTRGIKHAASSCMVGW